MKNRLMSARVMRSLLVCALLTALASCVAPAPSTSRPLSAPPQAALAPFTRPPPIIVPGTEPKELQGRFCLLGTARCADLGPPATACLLSGKRCGREGGKLERIEEAPSVPSP